MNSKIIFGGLVAVFATLFLMSVVSAAVLTLDPISVSPNPVDHDAGSFIVTFKMTNDGVADSGVSFAGSSVTTGIGTVTLATVAIGDGIPTPQILTLTATVTFAAGQSGVIAGFIEAVPADFGNPRTLDFSVTINDATGLSITKVPSEDLEINQDGMIVVKNEGNTALTGVTLSSTGDFDITFDQAIFDLQAGADKTVTVSSEDLDNLDFGDNKVTIIAMGKDGLNNDIISNSVEYNVQGAFCRSGSVGGNLEITDIDIDNQGEGGDDDWQLLDIIEIEIEIENIGDDDLDDIIVEIGLFDSSGDNVIDDLDFENADEEEFDLGDLKDGKDDVATFVFRIPADLDDGDYKLAVKAYSDDEGESNECIDTSSDLSDDAFEDIEIERETDEGRFIAFEDIVISPSEATCGDVVSLTTNIFNIGDEDQDQVRVNLFNSQLGLSESFEIRNDLDEGDKEKITFEFLVPNVEEGSFQLRLSSDYDYRRGTYRESSEEDKVVLLKVLGCSGFGQPSGGDRIVTINAVLDSDAAAGEQLTVRATITNLMSTGASFVINIDRFQSWASLNDISQRIIELGPGESRDVILTLDVDEDANGQESFELEVISNGESETREIVVNIGSSSTGSGGASFDLGGNTYLWIIGIINVVLIILIIVVAVRISRR